MISPMSLLRVYMCFSIFKYIYQKDFLKMYVSAIILLKKSTVDPQNTFKIVWENQWSTQLSTVPSLTTRALKGSCLRKACITCHTCVTSTASGIPCCLAVPVSKISLLLVSSVSWKSKDAYQLIIWLASMFDIYLNHYSIAFSTPTCQL